MLFTSKTQPTEGAAGLVTTVTLMLGQSAGVTVCGRCLVVMADSWSVLLCWSSHCRAWLIRHDQIRLGEVADKTQQSQGKVLAAAGFG